MRAAIVRGALHDRRAGQGQKNADDQSDESGDGGLPAGVLASQSAAYPEAEKTDQQRQVFDIGKYADFSGDPADEGEFCEEGERAGQKQGREIPAVGRVGGLGSGLDYAVADQKNGGQDEARDAQGHFGNPLRKEEQNNTRG